MTNEKAIEILEEVKANNDGMSQYLEGFDEAFGIAVEAIKKQTPKKPGSSAINIEYLKERYKRAESLCADRVKVDIEEFASLLEWIDEEHNRMTDAVERGYKWGRTNAYDAVIRELEKLKSEIRKEN